MLNAYRHRLIEAVERNAAIVLSLPSAGILRHHKSRFLALTGEGLWVESVPSESSLLDELVATGQPAGIAFKTGETKIVCSAPIRARERGYHLSQETAVEALRMDVPPDLKSIQRRAHYRAKVEADDLTAKVWRIAAGADLRHQPVSAQQLQAEVRDISLGGMGVIFRGVDNQPPKVTKDETLRVELCYGSHSMLLEGQVCSLPKACDGAVRCGVRWTSLQDSIDGRRRLADLTRFIGELERRELRRARLNPAAA